MDQTCLLHPLKNHHIISKLDTNKTDYQKCPLCNVADGTSFKRSEQASLAKKESKKEASDDCIGGALFPCELVRFACCCCYEESRASLCKGLLDNLEGSVGRNHTKTLGTNQILHNQDFCLFLPYPTNLNIINHGILDVKKCTYEPQLIVQVIHRNQSILLYISQILILILKKRYM